MTFDDETEAPKSLAYFPFMAAEWLTSPRVRALSPAARGALVDLLAWSWRHEDCAIPNDEDAIASLSGLGADWPRHRETLLGFFPVVPGKASLRRSPTLHRRYIDALAAYESRVAAAGARWSRARATQGAAGDAPAVEACIAAADAAVASRGGVLAAFVAGSTSYAALLHSLAAALGDPSVATMAVHECGARLEGMHGPQYDPEGLATAIADFLAKHADKRPGYSALKRFLAVGVKPKPEPGSSAPRSGRSKVSSPALLGESAESLASKYL